jgi:hypothetical protein
VSEEEEAPDVSEEEEEPLPVGVEEEPLPTSPPSRPSWRREESGVAAARASHLLHTRGRRIGAVMAGASHLVAQGRRSGAARGRSKPPVVVSGLPFCELQVLANLH